MRRTLTPANSPVSSPSKHGDRFIPSRAGANWSISFHRINVRPLESLWGLWVGEGRGRKWPRCVATAGILDEVSCWLDPAGLNLHVCFHNSCASVPLFPGHGERWVEAVLLRQDVPKLTGALAEKTLLFINGNCGSQSEGAQTVTLSPDCKLWRLCVCVWWKLPGLELVGKAPLLSCPSRKTKNLRARIEKQKMLPQITAKVDASSYMPASFVCVPLSSWSVVYG